MDTSAPGDTGAEETRPAPSSAKGPVRAYAPAVLDERQPRLTDLAPQRAYVLLMVALVGLTAVASIEAAYIHLYSAVARGALLPGVDLARPGNLAAWFSSIVLALGAGMALVVYSMRVHRVDDYRGRYRVWLWTSAALVWGSLSAATGIHQSLNAACLALAGLAGEGAGQFIWLPIYGVVLGGLGLWLACELWPSVEAFAALAVAACLYLLGAVSHVGALPLEGTLVGTVVQTTTLMLAHGMLAYALTLYARHVHLDAQGRLLVQVEKPKRKKKPAARLAVVGGDEVVEPRPKKGSTAEKSAGASISAATLKSPAAKPLAVVEAASDDEAESQGAEKLSRAERRRLKKLAQQGEERDEQRRAA